MKIYISVITSSHQLGNVKSGPVRNNETDTSKSETIRIEKRELIELLQDFITCCSIDELVLWVSFVSLIRSYDMLEELSYLECHK